MAEICMTRRINGFAQPGRFGVCYNTHLWKIFIFFHFFSNTSPKLSLLSNNMSDLTYLHHIWVKSAFNYVMFLQKLDLLSLILVHILIYFDQIIIFSHQKLFSMLTMFQKTLYTLVNIIIITEKLYVDILDMKLHAIEGNYTNIQRCISLLYSL